MKNLLYNGCRLQSLTKPISSRNKAGYFSGQKLLLQDTQARKSLAFQEFQGGTASGGNVGESCLIEA